jgi:hypothetical protein
MALTALLVAVPCSAYAADPSLQPYASVTLGWAKANFSLGSPYNGSVDDGSLTYGLEAGLGFGDHWGGELALNRYNEFDGRANLCAPATVCAPTITDQPVDEWLWHLAIVRRFTVGNFRFFGKAGYYHANINTSIPYEPSDFHENGLMLGIGTRWYFKSPWNVSIEGVRYDDNVTQFLVGVGWGRGFDVAARARRD